MRWAQAQLQLGRPDEVIDPVRELLGEHPLAEAMTGVLMQALAAAGREAEALETYAQTRARLIDDLGTEPGAQLQRVHQEHVSRTHPIARRARTSRQMK